MKTKRSLKMNDMESRILERKEQMMVKGGTEPPPIHVDCECSVPDEGDTIWFDDSAIADAQLNGEEKPPIFID